MVFEGNIASLRYLQRADLKEFDEYGLNFKLPGSYVNIILHRSLQSSFIDGNTIAV